VKQAVKQTGMVYLRRQSEFSEFSEFVGGGWVVWCGGGVAENSENSEFRMQDAGCRMQDAVRIQRTWDTV